jgi:hypothetical protein
MYRLRTDLNVARAEYRQLRYDGDLGAELLPRRRAAARWWLLPVATGAIAAMTLIAVRHRTAPTAALPPASSIASAVSSSSHASTRPTRSALFAVADINYHVYVRDVNANVRDTVGVLTGSIDRALSAPVVTDGVRKVDEVTDDLKDIATQTWSQLRSAPRPPC